MFNRKIWIMTTSIGLFACPSYAFDPFTVGSVVGAGAGALSAVSGAAGEVSSTANAFTDLYSEIDSDSEVGQSGSKIIREIKEIEALAYDVGYTKEELEQLTEESASSDAAKRLSTTLQSMTKAVRAGKRVARLFMKLDEKAKLAQVESTQIQREQLVALYKQIEMEHARELRDIKDELKELKNKKSQIEVLKREEKEAGAKLFGKTGVLSFPKQDAVMEEALRLAMSLRPALFSLLLLVFLSRALFYQFGFFGANKHGSLIRDTLICSLLLMVFPEIVRLSIQICNDLASQIGPREMQEIDPKTLDFPPTLSLLAKTRIGVEWLFQWIKFVAFTVTKFLSNFGLSFLILLFPIIIFCSQMLSFTVAWPIFLGGFISICLWPLLWNATGLLAVLIWRKQNATISDQIATVLFSILQFLSPLIAVSALKGQHLYGSIRSASGTLSSAATGATGSITNQAKGFVMGTAGHYGGSKLGRAVAYPINQGLSRMIAGGMRGKAATGTQQGVLRAVGSGVVFNERSAPEMKRSARARFVSGFGSKTLLNSKGDHSHE